jgi:hypothetical protein
MTKLLVTIVFTVVACQTAPMLAGEVNGAALACFPDPNYPVPRPPQCLDPGGLSMYTETGGPNRDLLYQGSTFQQMGFGSYTLSLGKLTLVGAGIRSTINDALHLSVILADQYGEIGTASYTVSVSGFAVYDSMRRQSVGQVSLTFSDPEPKILNTAFGSYSLVLNVPSTPFLLTIPSGTSNDESVSYDITARLTSLQPSEYAAGALVSTPEPGTLSLLGVSGAFLTIGLLRRSRRVKST